MSKTEDIRQEAWDAANMAVVHAPEYTDQLHKDVARAILKAKRDAYEEAAKVAEIAPVERFAMIISDQTVSWTRKQIVDAIRKLGETP